MKRRCLILKITNRTTLPITKPFVLFNGPHANALSILCPYPKTHSWLLTHFVQLVAWQNEWVDYLDFDFRNCELINYQRIDKKLLKKQWNSNIISFIIEAISNGFYVYLLVKTEYIKAYKGLSGIHDMFIYGYNKETETFEIADNFVYGKYDYQTCTFEELTNAFNNLSTSHEKDYYGASKLKGAVELISYNDEVELSFNLKVFVESLKDYILGTVPRPGFNNYDYSPHVYGCKSIYEVIISHLQGLHEDKISLDIRKPYIMWEHKSVMLKRITFLENSSLISNKKMIEDFKNLEQQLDMLKNKYIKFALNNEKHSLEQMIESYDKLLVFELDITNELLNDISKNVN